MELKLHRKYRKSKYTIGNLYINNEFFCNTLEDTDRLFNGEGKIPGRTAIPCGTYKVRMDVISPKYSQKIAYAFTDGKMPRLMNVPLFDGILIHAGNIPEDTEGCILVGKNSEVGKVLQSMDYFRRLYIRLKAACTMHDPITITIY